MVGTTLSIADAGRCSRVIERWSVLSTSTPRFMAARRTCHVPTAYALRTHPYKSSKDDSRHGRRATKMCGEEVYGGEFVDGKRHGDAV